MKLVYKSPEMKPDTTKIKMDIGWKVRQLYGPIFTVVFVTFHILYPLRGRLISPPFVSWHEEGHIGAWNMKVRFYMKELP